MTVAQDAKKTVEKAGKHVKKVLADESPIDRIQDAAAQLDSNLRGFAKAQPVMALVIAIGAGYIIGRAVARLS